MPVLKPMSLLEDRKSRPQAAGLAGRMAALAIRPLSMGGALVAQAYLLHISPNGFVLFNGIYAAQNILAHVFFPGGAVLAFRMANGFAKLQRRLFFWVALALLAAGLALLPVWSIGALVAWGCVPTAARSIIADYHLGAGRAIRASLLGQILPWTTLIIMLALLQKIDDIQYLPLLMVLPSGAIALWVLLGLTPVQLDPGLVPNWRLGVFSVAQSLKNHGVSLLAAPFTGGEVAGALFAVKLVSALQNIVAYAGAPQVRHLSLALASHKHGALGKAMREGVLLGSVFCMGLLLLVVQPYWGGLDFMAALAQYIALIIGLVALMSPFFITRYMAVNLLTDAQLLAVNLLSLVLLVLVYGVALLVMPAGAALFAGYMAATLFFAGGLTVLLWRRLAC